MTLSIKALFVTRIHWTGGVSIALIGGGIDAELGTSPAVYLFPRIYPCSDVMSRCFSFFGVVLTGGYCDGWVFI